MVSHGINITGLFMITGMLEKRTGTRQIPALGGIAAKAPWLAAFFMILLLGSIALPMTNGFIGEILLLLGIFKANVWIAAVAGLTVILSAVYMLRMYQQVMLGQPNPLTEGIADLDRFEILILVPFVILVFWIGLFPGLFLDLAKPAFQDILHLIP
jgi:NADH-quinone oxidoreductase subunit M